MLSPLSTLILCMDFLISNSYPNVGIHNDGRALNCVVIYFHIERKEMRFLLNRFCFDSYIKQVIETVSLPQHDLEINGASDVDVASIFSTKSHWISYNKW